MVSSLIKKLENEGYRDIHVRPFAPDTEFPKHTHDMTTVHIILEGELTLIENGENKILKKGERFEIPAGTTHSAKCGPKGCTFIVGVKT